MKYIKNSCIFRFSFYLLKAINQLIELLLWFQVTALVMINNLLPCPSYFLISFAINYFKVMVQLLSDLSLIISIFHLCVCFLSKTCLFVRKLEILLLFFVLLPSSIFYVFFEPLNPMIKIFNLKIFVINSILSPLEFIKRFSVSLILLANILIFFFGHFNLFIKFLYLIFKMIFPINSFIIIRLFFSINKLLNLLLQFFIFVFDMIVLLLNLPIFINLSQNISVFLFKFAISFI